MFFKWLIPAVHVVYWLWSNDGLSGIPIISFILRIVPNLAFLPCTPYSSLPSHQSYRCFSTAFPPHTRLPTLTRYPECLFAGAAGPTVDLWAFPGNAVHWPPPHSAPRPAAAAAAPQHLPIWWILIWSLRKEKIYQNAAVSLPDVSSWLCCFPVFADFMTTEYVANKLKT